MFILKLTEWYHGWGTKSLYFSEISINRFKEDSRGLYNYQPRFWNFPPNWCILPPKKKLFLQSPQLFDIKHKKYNLGQIILKRGGDLLTIHSLEILWKMFKYLTLGYRYKHQGWHRSSWQGCTNLDTQGLNMYQIKGTVSVPCTRLKGL